MLRNVLVSDSCCCGVTVMVSQCLEQALAVEELFTVVGLTEWYMSVYFHTISDLKPPVSLGELLLEVWLL